MSNTLNYDNYIQGFQGNTKNLVTVVYDASNNLMDISDYTGYIYMQKYPIRANNPIDASLVHTSKDPSNGAFLFNFIPSQLNLTPGDYVYEVIITDGSLNVHTVVQDRFNIVDSIAP